MILNPLDYRSTSGGASGGTAGDSPSAGSEYDEPRRRTSFSRPLVVTGRTRRASTVIRTARRTLSTRSVGTDFREIQRC
jgi:hypothetical protein